MALHLSPIYSSCPLLQIAILQSVNIGPISYKYTLVLAKLSYDWSVPVSVPLQLMVTWLPVAMLTLSSLCIEMYQLCDGDS